MFTAVGTQSQVNTTIAQDQFLNGTFKAPDGTVYAIYTTGISSSNGSPSNFSSVNLRALDATGSPSGAEISLALPTPLQNGNTLSHFEITILSNGNIAMAVSEDVPGVSVAGIHTLVYSISGSLIATGPVITLTDSNYSYLDSIIANPSGGFFVIYYDQSYNGIVNSQFDNNGSYLGNYASTGQLQNPSIVGFANGLPITQSYIFTSNQQVYAIDFPGSAGPISVNNNIGFDIALSTESATSVFGAAVESDLYTTGTLTFANLKFYRFVDGATTATLLSSINVMPVGYGQVRYVGDPEILRLTDGSFAVSVEFETSGNQFHSQLRHISSTGFQLGATIDLNTSGQEGGVSLQQLANGTLVATYTGITPTTGTDLEVFRELFVVPPPSSVPSAGDDVINGTAGNDVIDSLAGNDTINGLAGDDILNGGDGNDILNGGDGNDTLTGGNGIDQLNGNAGNDIINFTSIDTVSGGDGDDTMILTGIYGGNWSGGTGFDIADFTNATTGAKTATGGAITFISTERGLGTAFDDYFKAVDAAGASAKELYGFAGNDILEGASLNDILDGGDGNDLFIGGAGADTIRGGAGIDTVFYGMATTVVVARLDTPTQYGQYGSGAAGALEVDILTGIENLVGGSAADYLYGDANANRLEGNGGNDYIEAGAGDDTILGGAGQEYIDASYGNDTVDGGSEGDVIYGGGDNDTITGGAGDDSIYGDSGADSLSGGDGVDVLFVDSADTFFDGGAGIDYLVWQDVAVAANVNLAAHSLDYAYGYNGDDVFYASGAATRVELHGGGGNDTLTGGGFGGSILLGENGNDRLIGDYGIDHMLGGAGIDTFLFKSFGGTDYVYDFTSGVDKIDFKALAIDGIHSLANLTVITEYGGAGWYGYSHATGTAWINTFDIGSIQPLATDFLFA